MSKLLDILCDSKFYIIIWQVAHPDQLHWGYFMLNWIEIIDSGNYVVPSGQGQFLKTPRGASVKPTITGYN